VNPIAVNPIAVNPIAVKKDKCSGWISERRIS
jgi:hypothetical protein